MILYILIKAQGYKYSTDVLIPTWTRQGPKIIITLGWEILEPSKKKIIIIIEEYILVFHIWNQWLIIFI